MYLHLFRLFNKLYVNILMNISNLLTLYNLIKNVKDSTGYSYKQSHTNNMNNNPYLILVIKVSNLRASKFDLNEGLLERFSFSDESIVPWIWR